MIRVCEEDGAHLYDMMIYWLCRFVCPYFGSRLAQQKCGLAQRPFLYLKHRIGRQVVHTFCPEKGFCPQMCPQICPHICPQICLLFSKADLSSGLASLALFKIARANGYSHTRHQTSGFMFVKHETAHMQHKRGQRLCNQGRVWFCAHCLSHALWLF